MRITDKLLKIKSNEALRLVYENHLRLHQFEELVLVALEEGEEFCEWNSLKFYTLSFIFAFI